MKNRKIKIFKTGWVARSVPARLLIESMWGEWNLNDIVDGPGLVDGWHPEDWPPRKVRITIEEIKP